MHRRTERWTNRGTDIASYRVVCTRLGIARAYLARATFAVERADGSPLIPLIPLSKSDMNEFGKFENFGGAHDLINPKTYFWPGKNEF